MLEAFKTELAECQEALTTAQAGEGNTEAAVASVLVAVAAAFPRVVGAGLALRYSREEEGAFVDAA